MFRQVAHFVLKLCRTEDGVTSLEYCILFGGVTFFITLAGFSGIGPEIDRLLDNAFDPAVVLGQGEGEGGICVAQGGTENCGVGVGLDGGNGTPNEGNGQGPGPDHENFENPVHG